MKGREGNGRNRKERELERDGQEATKRKGKGHKGTVKEKRGRSRIEMDSKE